jgi:hypothetical protein
MKKRRKAARLEVINACLLAAEATVSAKLARLPRELRMKELVRATSYLRQRGRCAQPHQSSLTGDRLVPAPPGRGSSSELSGPPKRGSILGTGSVLCTSRCPYKGYD